MAVKILILILFMIRDFHLVQVNAFMYLREYFLSYVYLKDLYKTLKEIEISKLSRSLS